MCPFHTNPFESNRPLCPPCSYDLETGLLRRLAFLQRAAAEFRRARRYERHLSLCVVTTSQPDVDGEAFHALSMLVEENTRAGIDIVGRTAERQLGVLLPETHLVGAMSFASRLRKTRLRTTWTAVPGFTTREAICLPDDTAFKDLLQRCL